MRSGRRRRPNEIGKKTFKKKQGPPKEEKLRFFFSISWVRAQNGPRVNNGPITAAERVRKKQVPCAPLYNARYPSNE